ncbi:MAG: hypothetical protein VKK04_10240 [Synechococcales bacterium]|nr:hypothetical protein [Synechococcales bacterium]
MKITSAQKINPLILQEDLRGVWGILPIHRKRQNTASQVKALTRSHLNPHRQRIEHRLTVSLGTDPRSATILRGWRGEESSRL